MCSSLQGDETSRYPLKCLLHPFRCRRHFLFQKDFARFIQNAVVRPAIAEVHTNRELVSFENYVSIYSNQVAPNRTCTISAFNQALLLKGAEERLHFAQHVGLV